MGTQNWFPTSSVSLCAPLLIPLCPVTPQLTQGKILCKLAGWQGRMICGVVGGLTRPEPLTSSTGWLNREGGGSEVKSVDSSPWRCQFPHFLALHQQSARRPWASADYKCPRPNVLSLGSIYSFTKGCLLPTHCPPEKKWIFPIFFEKTRLLNQKSQKWDIYLKLSIFCLNVSKYLFDSRTSKWLNFFLLPRKTANIFVHKSHQHSRPECKIVSTVPSLHKRSKPHVNFYILQNLQNRNHAHLGFSTELEILLIRISLHQLGFLCCRSILCSSFYFGHKAPQPFKSAMCFASRPKLPPHFQADMQKHAMHFFPFIFSPHTWIRKNNILTTFFSSGNTFLGT